MKFTLLALILFAVPNMAIADNLPANYIILRGQIFNLDHLWGKGIITDVPIQTTQQPIAQTDSREVAANKQRVEFENARSQIFLERLRNIR